MRYSCLLLYFASAAVVQGALQENPPCPRKRGLSEGLTWARNKIQKRTLYKLNVRKASDGFYPEEKYKLRVHTTYLKRKFDDAQVFLEALDKRCGSGSFIVQDTSLFTPKGCPDIVATRTKEPMGRADVFWKAPPCGCVNIRVRIHADGKYFLDDETTDVGPLSKRLCPKDRSLWNFPEKQEQTSRTQKYSQLCNLANKFGSSDVAKNEWFVTRRDMHELTEFEKERLETALELRSVNIKQCCAMEANLSNECFGDLRRRQIDRFCGTGETDIPLTTYRKEWITERKSECCWQIGEERYHCFNYTLYEETMLKDGRITESERNDLSLDEFDPINYIEDYPTEAIIEKVPVVETTTQMTYGSEPISISMSHSHNSKQDSTETETEAESRDEDESRTETEDFNEYDAEESAEEKHSHTEVDETGQIDKDRVLTKEECCYNGITAGTRVEKEGLLGCFRIAEIFSSLFTKWTTQCDRRFVVCCMRVVDGHLRLRHSQRRSKLLWPFPNDVHNNSEKTSLSYFNNITLETNLTLPIILIKHGFLQTNETRLKTFNITSALITDLSWNVLDSVSISSVFIFIIILLIILCHFLRLLFIEIFS